MLGEYLLKMSAHEYSWIELNIVITTNVHLQTTTVKLWIQRYEDERNVQRHFSPGRPKITTIEQDTAIVDYIKANPFSTAQRAGALNDVPYQTALKRVHKSGLETRVAAHEIKLTEQHKRDRINHCRNMLDVFGEENFPKIIFTDEKPFDSDECRYKRVYRPKGTRYQQEYIVHDSRSGHVSANYWGWISCAGPGEIVATGTHFNSVAYIKLLDEIALPSIEAQFGDIQTVYFMHDNSPVHTARIVREYLQSKHVPMLNHPPRSPDLNLIENVWALLEKDRPPLIERTHAGLDLHVINRWEDLRLRQGEPNYY